MTDPSRPLPLVAVVTPVYNGGAYLAQAMRSVQAQTYENIVHIVLNNASTDQSQATIDSFSDGPIRVLAFANDATVPLHENWNRAFSHVPREAVFAKLLCADDMMHPQAIERFVDLANSDDDIQLVLSFDVFADEVRRANLPEEVAVYDGKFILQQLLGGRIGWLAYHHFFVRMPEDLRGDNFCGSDWSPDTYVVARSFTYGKFGYIPEPLVYNRLHPDSVTGKEISSGGINSHIAPLLLMQRFSRYAFDEAGSKRALDRYLKRMARLVLLLRATGRRPSAEAIRRALAEHGLSFSTWDYLRAIVGWPRYWLDRRRVTAPSGPSIDESSFMRTKLKTA